MRSPLGPVRLSAVRSGAALALAAAAPAVVIASLSADSLDLDGHSNWVFVFYGVAVAGFVAGGRLSARRGHRGSPLLHGALGALAAYAVLGGVGTAIRLMSGREADLLALGVNALIGAAAGIVGGLLAASVGPMRRRPARSRDQPVANP